MREGEKILVNFGKIWKCCFPLTTARNLSLIRDPSSAEKHSANWAVLIHQTIQVTVDKCDVKGGREKLLSLNNWAHLFEAGVLIGKDLFPFTMQIGITPQGRVHTSLVLVLSPPGLCVPLTGSCIWMFQGLFVYANVASLLRELVTGAGSLISARQV